MLKTDAKKLFKKLFVSESRTKTNWKNMLDSLAQEKEITKKQAYKWAYFGNFPTK